MNLPNAPQHTISSPGPIASICTSQVCTPYVTACCQKTPYLFPNLLSPFILHPTIPSSHIHPHTPELDQKAYPEHQANLCHLPTFILPMPFPTSRPNLPTQKIHFLRSHPKNKNTNNMKDQEPTNPIKMFSIGLMRQFSKEKEYPTHISKKCSSSLAIKEM